MLEKIKRSFMPLISHLQAGQRDKRASLKSRHSGDSHATLFVGARGAGNVLALPEQLLSTQPSFAHARECSQRTTTYQGLPGGSVLGTCTDFPSRTVNQTAAEFESGRILAVQGDLQRTFTPCKQSDEANH